MGQQSELKRYKRARRRLFVDMPSPPDVAKPGTNAQYIQYCDFLSIFTVTARIQYHTTQRDIHALLWCQQGKKKKELAVGRMTLRND